MIEPLNAFQNWASGSARNAALAITKAPPARKLRLLIDMKPQTGSTPRTLPTTRPFSVKRRASSGPPSLPRPNPVRLHRGSLSTNLGPTKGGSTSLQITSTYYRMKDYTAVTLRPMNLGGYLDLRASFAIKGVVKKLKRGEIPVPPPPQQMSAAEQEQFKKELERHRQGVQANLKRLSVDSSRAGHKKRLRLDQELLSIEEILKKSK
jgi:hypothetical protein